MKELEMLHREKWINENRVNETILAVIREAYNTGFLCGQDNPPIKVRGNVWDDTEKTIDIERRRAECQ